MLTSLAIMNCSGNRFRYGLVTMFIKYNKCWKSLLNIKHVNKRYI